MTPSPLEEARGRVRSAASSLQLATQAGRVEIKTAGELTDYDGRCTEPCAAQKGGDRD